MPPSDRDRLLAVVSLFPVTRRLLGTAPLNIADLLVIAAGVVLPLVVNEGTKPSPPDETEDENEDQTPAEYTVSGAAVDTEQEEIR